MRYRAGLISDDRTIERAPSGCSAESRELVLRYQNAVYAIAWRILGRREDAEDVAQETFIQALGSLSSCRDKTNYWPWIRRIAINICIKRIPREHPSDHIDEMVNADCEQGNPVEAEALRHVAMDQVKAAVAQLPAAYRVALVLRYGENLSYQEIAGLTGEDERAVGTRLHRAKKMLAERLAGVEL